MSRLRCQISVSLDGYVAGPDQSLEDPLGVDGERLHEWAFATDAWGGGGDPGADDRILAEATENVGAYVMGRKMFGGGAGAWDPDWKGWWGEDPPFHVPVFVLTHRPREPLVMEGGTTFTFVTGGIEAAAEQAFAAAGDEDVMVAGGATAVQQYLAAGMLDELHLHIVPLLLRAGERLLDGVGTLALEPVEVVASPAVTHIKYRVAR